MPEDSKDILVEISDLFVNFYTYQGTVQAIEGVDLVIRKGETLGVVGETGCGKSVTASTIMRLILSPPGKTEWGSIYFLEPEEVRNKRLAYEAEAQANWGKLPIADKRKAFAEFGPRFTGFKKRVKPLSKATVDKLVAPKKAPSRYIAQFMASKAKKVPSNDKVSQEALRKTYDLLAKSDAYMRKIRGKFISMIFQEPTSALNPVITAGNQVAEVILQHRRSEMASRVLKRLDGEMVLMKKNLRPRRVPRVVKNLQTKPPPGKSGSGKGKDKGQKVVLECSVCKGEVRKDEAWCDNCGNNFYSELSWRLRPSFLSAYKSFFSTIKKNPDAKETLLYKIPPWRQVQKELLLEALREAVRMLEVVRIPDPKGVAYRYPYELSGGMQQRVMIAMALACNPRLLIADEPTTALDVTIQGQILKLMRDLKDQYGSSILLITHNLGVVAEMCDRVGVMYAGSMAEVGLARAIYKAPKHPYTIGLMNAVPSVQKQADRLFTIRGSVPNLIYPPSGCRFHPRCDYAKEYCKKVKPELKETEPNHCVACHMATREEGYVKSS